MERALTMASKPPFSMALAKLAAGLGASWLVAACSFSIPMAGFVDRAPTGSIEERPSIKTLSGALDREDLRRANAALAVALDPQGNGTNVAWANPETGSGGSFVSLAPPYPSHDGICRAFGGNILVHAEPNRKIRGSACRTAGGEWIVADIRQHD